MIGTAVTFVIGAGASTPYNLPIGQGLKDRAIGLSSQNSPVYRLLTTSGVDPIRLQNFCNDLKNHPMSSIDAYLETRQFDPEILKIGRLVIAALMGELLQDVRKANPIHDWIHYLFRRMQDGAKDEKEFFEGNKIKFVTFNFDSVIENSFKDHVSSCHPKCGNSDFPQVIHVHGKLPPVPHVKLEPQSPDNYFSKPTEWIKWLSESAPKINIVIDEIDNNVLETARDALAEAKIVCFLGFQFAVANVKKLFRGGNPKKFGTPPEFYGSAYGMSEGEQADVATYFPGGIKLGTKDEDCCSVLKKFRILRSQL